MAGILENPDAAFGKLRELGQGLFGPNFLGGNQGGQPGQPAQGGTGNKLIEGIGSLIQQGLGGRPGAPQSAAPQSQGQAPQAQAPQSTQPGQPQPAQPGQPSQTPQNQQLDNIIRQLFGR
jgi:AsmA protein